MLDVEELRRRIDELEHQAADPELWNDQEHAQQAVTSQLSHSQAELRRVEELRPRLDDMPVLYELAEDEGDARQASPMPTPSGAALREDIDAMEVRTLLSGEYDQRDALVNIRSGAGGVDAADWAEMLMRMYIRWAEKHGYGVEVYDTSYAEEAGIKSRDVRGEGAVHLRHAVGRAGHAPAGPDQPVRQPGPPADVVRRGRGAARGRDHRPHRRSPRTTSASTCTARPVPVGRASTPPTPRCGSRTSRPASS